MQTPAAIAKQGKALYFGGNYTGVNFTDILKDVTYEQAVFKVKDFNTIHPLLFHTQYYIDAVINVLEGNRLESSDPSSFVVEAIHSQKDWQLLVDTMFESVITFTKLIENMTEGLMYKSFEKEAYGTYYRNITGVIEHSNYHLGQIVFLKKMT
jgi:hypothetical protein